MTVALAPDLLADCRVAMAGGDGEAIRERLRSLGAWVDHLGTPLLADEDAAAAWARERRPMRAAVIGTEDELRRGDGDGLRAALDLTWRAVRAVATGALIEAGAPARLILVAPRPGAGPHAAAARAGLENLARTLSVEWARFAITSVAITPGAATTDTEVAELVAFLVSPAGGYYSGCRFDLGAVAAPATAV